MTWQLVVRVSLLLLVLFSLTAALRHSGLYLGRNTSLPPGFSETLVATGLSQPTSLTVAPDGRLFITEQRGAVRIVENNVLLARPFVELETAPGYKHGLLGLAFDPDFETNQWVYVYDAAPSTFHNRLTRFTAQGNVAQLNSRVTLFESEPFSGLTNHHGGSPLFDARGNLYLSVGDDARSPDPQQLDSLFGKVLRLTRAGAPAPDNPFVNTANARPEIFAYGFRHPYNLALDARTGTILVNDVGEEVAEEINLLRGGANYGWNVCEGKCEPPRADLQDPLLSYPHGRDSASGCAIVGGTFYQPPQIQFPPDYADRYFYADLCVGWIRALNLTAGDSILFATGLFNPIDLEIGNDGALYYLERGRGADYYNTKFPGQLWRIDYRSTEPHR